MRTYEEQTALILDKVSMYNIARKKRMRMIRSLTIAVVILFSLTGVAFAAYTNLNLGSIFNTFFNNPSIDQRIDVGYTTAEGGLEVTLLSVFSDSSKAYMMVEIKDVEDERLSDSIAVVSLNRGGLGVEKVIYNEIDNKATLILSMDFTSGVSEGDTVQLKIDAIFSGSIDEPDYTGLDFRSDDDAAWLMSFQGRRYEHTISGPWEIIFEVDAVISSKRTTAFPTDSLYLAKLEIECSPMATRIDMYSPRSRVVGGDAIDPGDVSLDSSDTEAIDAWEEYVAEMDAYTRSMMDYILDFGDPYLTLNDGSTVILVPNTGHFYYFGTGEGNVIYIGDYFDIGELHSITFCGDEYVFE